MSIDASTTIVLLPDFRTSSGAPDGIASYSRGLLRALAEGPWQAHWVVVTDADSEEAVRTAAPGLERVVARPGRGLPDVLWHMRALPELATQLGADVVHLFAGNRRASPLQPERTLVTIHDLDHRDHPGDYGPLPTLHFRSLVLPALARRPWAIAVSEATREQAVTAIPELDGRVTVVPNGHDSEAFRPSAPGEVAEVRARYGLGREFALHVGSTPHPRKNLPALLAAWRLLRERVADPLELVLVGGGAGTGDLDVLTDPIPEVVNEADHRPRALGPVPQRDLAALYGAAAVVVQPSLREGFGLPVLEAMACGAPVAASDIPALREVGGDAVVWFDPARPDDIADTVARLMADRELRDRLRRAGPERARTFTWRATAEATVACYAAIAGAAPSRPSAKPTSTTAAGAYP